MTLIYLLKNRIIINLRLITQNIVVFIKVFSAEYFNNIYILKMM